MRGLCAQLVEGFTLWPEIHDGLPVAQVESAFRGSSIPPGPRPARVAQKRHCLPQALRIGSEPIRAEIRSRGLSAIDEISAQRGFGFATASVRADDPNDENKSKGGKKLSTQLRNYYTQHLDPFDQPEPKDLEALHALHEAQAAFGKRLESCFSSALKELEDIGYPGVTDPKLTITTSIKPIDGLNHASAVQYEVPTHVGAADGLAHRLPEDSNGLGYQNLVSIVFAPNGLSRQMDEGWKGRQVRQCRGCPGSSTSLGSCGRAGGPFACAGSTGIHQAGL